MNGFSLIPGCRAHTRCGCGAQMPPGSRRCEKCEARRRWMRRKSHRRFTSG